MPRYRFRLQTLRRLREIARDERQSQLATAYEAERILGEQQAALDAEAAGLVASQRQAMQQTPLNVSRLLEAQRYQLSLQAQSRVLAEQAEKLAVEVERRRAAVIEAEREVRVLDKLEARQRARHALERSRAETKLLDEMASIRWKGAC
jgi:flagellar FliJ protein